MLQTCLHDVFHDVVLKSVGDSAANVRDMPEVEFGDELLHQEK